MIHFIFRISSISSKAVLCSFVHFGFLNFLSSQSVRRRPVRIFGIFYRKKVINEQKAISTGIVLMTHVGQILLKHF